MSDDGPPSGRRYSLTYDPKPQSSSDSFRFRKRLAAFLENRDDSFPNLRGLVTIELGIDAPYSWDTFLTSIDLVDLRDFITLAWQCAKANDSRYNGSSSVFFDLFVKRAFAEQGLAYRLDDRGGVHPLIDQEFEGVRIETIARLGSANFRAAADAFSAGHEALSTDSLAAVRLVIDATENVFKVISGEPRIGIAEVRKLRSRLSSAYDSRATNAVGRLLESFGEWVNAAHNYRHADGQPDPSPPPLELAVAIMAGGATWIRWMLDLQAGTSGP